MIKSKILKSLLPLLAILFGGFCLITNSAGIYRIYNVSALPFVYRLHTSTPDDYIPYIEKAANEWGAVEGSYWEFKRGENTSSGTLGQNNENLVFFDLLGENFDPGTDVIAFSTTFTSNTGGFHAIESDYIYNGRDFPPGLNGEGGKQDLQSISIHELGHHTGLDHTGLPSGANSGCGPQVQSAVMWAFSTNGDTSKRHLTNEDIMGIVSLYPNWILKGKFTDATTGDPLPNSEVNLNGTLGSDIGPVINPIGTRRNKIGIMLSKLISDSVGNYLSAVKDKNFSISADKFGYYPVNKNISFNTITGFGNTQTITENISLLQTPIVSFSVAISDSVNNKPVKASYKLYWEGRKDSVLFEAVTGNNGLFSFTIPSAEYYKLVLEFNHPYKKSITYDSILVPEAGLNLNIKLKPVSVLFVKDSKNNDYEDVNENMLKSSDIEYAVWDTQEDTTISSEKITSFSQPLTIFWYTEVSDSSGLTEQEIEFLKDHLRRGGRLILTGVNIAENLESDSLLANYIGVTQTANQFGFPIKGYENDVIGNGISFNAIGAWKDILTISPSAISNVYRSLHYGTGAADTAKLAAVRFENKSIGYKGFFMGFGLESISDEVKRNDLLGKILDYLNSDFPTSIRNNPQIPLEYSLMQNFPNPFNPKTIISYTMPKDEMVELKIYNSIGQEVRTLVNSFVQSGIHRIEFDAKNLSSGIYYYRIKAGKFSDTKKLVILK